MKAIHLLFGVTIWFRNCWSLDQISFTPASISGQQMPRAMSFLEKDNDIRKLSQVDDDVDAELLIDKTAENGYIQFSVLVKPTANIEAADLFTSRL